MKKKRKIKKYLFSITETDNLSAMILSEDKDTVFLAYNMVKTSKPYRHYAKSRYPLAHLGDLSYFLLGPSSTIDIIKHYLSHYKYIK